MRRFLAPIVLFLLLPTFVSADELLYASDGNALYTVDLLTPR